MTHGRTNFPAYKVIAVADLKPYGRNARNHSDAQVGEIMAAISRWGFTNPLLIDETGEVIAGHGRLEAAKKLAMTELPAIELTGLSQAEQKALRLADNKLALNSTWDSALLAAELKQLATLEIDLSITGFAPFEIEALQAADLDIREAWDGMPEFEHGNKTAYQTIMIHFADAEAVTAFGRLIGQSFTSKTKSTWYPRIETRVLKDKAYVADAA